MSGLRLKQAKVEDLPSPVSVSDVTQNKATATIHSNSWDNVHYSKVTLAPGGKGDVPAAPIDVHQVRKNVGPLHGGGHIGPGSLCTIEHKDRDVEWCERRAVSAQTWV